MSDFRKFKFVSPGVRIDEIDNTLREALPNVRGALFIGRAKRGPIFKPIFVTSAKELVDIFGAPETGTGGNGDVWRNGDCLSPMYGLYAAYAYLQNHDAATFVRIAGDEHPIRTPGAGEAGWITTETKYSSSGTPAVKKDGGAYGLFVAPIKPTLNANTAVVSAGWGTAEYVLTGEYNQKRFSTGIFPLKIVITVISQTSNTYKVEFFNNSTLLYSSGTLDMNRGTPQAIVDDAPYGNTGLMITFLSGVTYSDNETITLNTAYSGNAVHAATFYVDSGALALEGKGLDGVTDVVGTAAFVKSTGPDYEFVARVYSSANKNINDYDKKIMFNFNERSSKYIRKVFNTNPTLANEEITTTDNVVNYWLGESYRSNVYKNVEKSDFGYMATLLKIERGDVSGANHLAPYRPAESGWVFSQNLDADGPGKYNISVGSYDPQKMVKLFKFHSIDGGSWFHANIKVSIDRIRYSKTRTTPYGSFDVVVRAASDTDKNPVILEMFANCNLDVNSSNFILKKIGDVHYVWSDEEKRYVKYGTYENNSKYIYVEVSNEVLEGTIEPSLLPWGYFGYPTYADSVVRSVDGTNVVFDTNTWVKGGNNLATSIAFPVSTTNNQLVVRDGYGVDVTFRPAVIRLREAFSEEGGSKYQNVFWGDRTTSWDVDRYDSDLQDYLRNDNLILRGKSGDDAGMQYSHIFTLDDVCYEEVNATPKYSLKSRAVYIKDSYKYGRSITAGYFRKQDGNLDNTIVPDYKLLCDLDAARFTMTCYGGFDGLDIMEKDPFRNTLLDNFAVPDDATESYSLYSLLKAIDVISDKDLVEYDVVTMPGITNNVVTRQLTEMARIRKDCLAIVDIPGQYLPSAENNLPETARKGSVSVTVRMKQETEIDENNSYAACYFNWIRIIDPFNRTMRVWLPPSVAAMGVLAYARKKGDVWDAPAGYNRANLSLGHSGLTVVDVMFNLDNDERDLLYENNINPIARFPEGVIIMGQKTLQKVQSYLDRINVRLLVNHIKKYVEFKGKRSLFEDNIYITWQKFINEVDPFLRDIQTRGGLNRYEIVFDDTTTTPEMVDRNEMYAKIYIQPTTVAEFFGVDLVIAKNGVTFND